MLLQLARRPYQGEKKKPKQKQTIAIISALIVLVRSPECLLNRVIAVEI